MVVNLVESTQMCIRRWWTELQNVNKTKKKKTNFLAYFDIDDTFWIESAVNTMQCYINVRHRVHEQHQNIGLFHHHFDLIWISPFKFFFRNRFEFLFSYLCQQNYRRMFTIMLSLSLSCWWRTSLHFLSTLFALHSKLLHFVFALFPRFYSPLCQVNNRRYFNFFKNHNEFTGMNELWKYLIHFGCTAKFMCSFDDEISNFILFSHFPTPETAASFVPGTPFNFGKFFC